MNDKLLELHQIVEKSFNNALANPDIARWKSCSILAGCAAVRVATDGDIFLAAKLEGVAEESRSQMFDLQKIRIAA